MLSDVWQISHQNGNCVSHWYDFAGEQTLGLPHLKQTPLLLDNLISQSMINVAERLTLSCQSVMISIDKQSFPTSWLYWPLKSVSKSLTQICFKVAITRHSLIGKTIKYQSLNICHHHLCFCYIIFFAMCACFFLGCLTSQQKAKDQSSLHKFVWSHSRSNSRGSNGLDTSQDCQSNNQFNVHITQDSVAAK